MKLGSTNTLGLAVTDHMIACAELSARADRRTLQRTATFTFPTELSLDKPEALGQALALFLRQKGFSASRAVVGVPAKWVIASEKDVPPASEAQVNAMLRLQAERMRVADGEEMVFDYVGESDASKPGRVLLVAMLRKQLDKIERMLDVAGITVTGITPTSLALATTSSSASDAHKAEPPMLMIARHGAEVVWQHHGTPRMLRHVAMPIVNGHGAAPMGPLGSELRRAVAMQPSPPPNGQGPYPPPSEMFLWDSVGLSDSQISELSDRIGLRVRSGAGLTALGVQTAPTAKADEVSPQQFAPAVALALAGGARDRLPLDFTRSRLAPPVQRKIGRNTVLAGAVGAALLLAILWLFVSVSLQRSELATINSQLASGADDVKAAEQLTERVKYTRGYFTRRTPVLDALREVTLSFRADEEIWAMRFNIKENPRTGVIEGVLEGKTTDGNTARLLYDRMRENERFTEVSLPTRAEASAGRSRDQFVSFAINFKFVPVETR